jgi:ATP-dependent Clp protease ATP-binding subunit ClpA
MQPVAQRRLDPTLKSVEAEYFEQELHQRVVGQGEAVQAMVDLYQTFRAGLNPPGRPVGNFLFLGPSGTGKTHIVEALAEIFFNDSRAVIKVNCAEFQHSHEIAKLIGSPPGYLGHRETHPLITKEALEQWQREDLKLSLLLFDEIEKASDALWQLLLGMLDKATLTLGDNRQVDLSQTIIFLTSNLGSREIETLLRGPGIGFTPTAEDLSQSKVEASATNAARSRFSPEFINRLDRMVVFHPLSDKQLDAVLSIEIDNVQRRILKMETGRFLIQISKSARKFLLDEGTDARYGARHLRRAIEKNVVSMLANLLSSKQIVFGDLISINYEPSGLTFTKEAEGVYTENEAVENIEPIISVEALKSHTEDVSEPIHHVSKKAQGEQKK